MALTPVSNTVEFVQDTVPSTANDGDSWLDTSLSPPRLKIFDADAGGFVEPRGGAELRFIGGFELSLASFTFSLNVDQSNIVFDGIAFNSDGTRMFIVGDNNTVGNPHPVQEYSLNTAFDLSTASLTNTSFDVSGQVPRPVDVTFNSDGTRMFVLGDDTADVHEFSLTTAFTGTSFSVSTQTNSSTGVVFGNEGTRMFVLDGSFVYQYLVGKVGPT